MIIFLLIYKKGGDFIEFLGLQIAQLGSTNTSHSSRFLAPSLSIASQNLAIKIHHDVENTCHLLPSIYLGKFDICFTRRKTSPTQQNIEFQTNAELSSNKWEAQSPSHNHGSVEKMTIL